MKFIIPVVRKSFSVVDFIVDADSKAEAEEKAIKLAPDHHFPTHESDFEIAANNCKDWKSVANKLASYLLQDDKEEIDFINFISEAGIDEWRGHIYAEIVEATISNLNPFIFNGMSFINFEEWEKAVDSYIEIKES